MKIRFQADADLSQEIVSAAIRQEPAIDFQTANEAGLEGLDDIELGVCRTGVCYALRRSSSAFGFLLHQDS
jgi:hypothetical protein